MEPVAIVTALLAGLIIVTRGSLVVAPATTVAFYRRRLSTPGRIRAFGGLLALLGVALIVTARQAHASQGDILFLIEGLGWFVAVAALWLIAAPASYKAVAESVFAASDSVLRALGLLGMAFGLFLGGVAFFVL